MINKNLKILEEKIKKVLDYNAEKGIKTNKTLIAKRLGRSRAYLSQLLGGKEEVSQKFLDHFDLVFKNELGGIIAPEAFSEEEAAQIATTKMLFNEVAKLKSKVSGVSLKECIQEMEESTILLLKDILK